MSSLEVQSFTYHHGDVELAGFMAQPSRYPRAAVLIVPTIAGPNKIMTDRAKWLASIGYAAMVCDIYGEGEITDSQKPVTWLASCAVILNIIGNVSGWLSKNCVHVPDLATTEWSPLAIAWAVKLFWKWHVVVKM